MPSTDPPLHRIRWQRAYRIVPSRFPPVGVFDAIAEPKDLDALYRIESLTNPRLREEWGELSNVPKVHRVSGPGTTPLMAAFTHLNPDGSRFSGGSYGVLYLAHEFDTAVEETVYHREQFLKATHEPPIDITMRCYVTGVHGTLHDIRNLGRYIDRWERRDGSWRIIHRRYVHDFDQTGPATGEFETMGKRDRSDPSYFDG